MSSNQQVLAIVSAALAQPAGAERDAFLERACAGDERLAARVQEAMQSTEQDGPKPVETEVIAPGESVGSRIGPYRILQEIGEGGCGVVYLAQQEGVIRRRVALKILKLGMDSRQVIARFEAERQALAIMDHPNIATVLDAGTTPTGRPFFVMELVRGVPITTYCDEAKCSTDQRLRLFGEVCKAIQHAHQKGIIHRDIKPSNVLVSLADGQPVPKVIDFGIAKATEGRLTDKTLFTSLDLFIGTPAYMSPEQMGSGGLDIDTRSDIYSLGVLLYELLVGRPPFEPGPLARLGIDEIRRRIREDDPLKPSAHLRCLPAPEMARGAAARSVIPAEWVRGVEGDLDWIVMKALEKERTRRYDSASDLAKDIERFLVNEPVQARPPSRLYRIQKFARRNKVTFTAGVITVLAMFAVLVALTIGMAVSTWLLIREREARRLAADARQEAALTEAEVVAFGNPELIERVSQARNFQDQLEQANTLVEQGRLTEAEPLLDRILGSAVSGGSFEAVVRELRADLRARQGRFREAAEDLERLKQIDADDHWNWFVLSPILIQLGDPAAYHAHRTAMLERFGGAPEALTAERVAKAAALSAFVADEAVGTSNLVATLLQAGDRAVYEQEFAQYRDAFKLAEALVSYRSGNLQAAELAAQPVLDSRYPLFLPAAHSVLAMTYQRQGRLAEARAALEAARGLAGQWVPELDNGDLGPVWNDILIADLLVEEASAMVERSGPNTPVDSRPTSAP